MKKIIALILAVAAIFTFTACGDTEYPPIESTELEAQTVMTAEFEGEKYNIKYELYRALFLNLRKEYDGGDASVWSGDKKAEYIEKIDAKIKERIADIYSTLHIAEKIGIDIYSDEFDEAVEEFIKISVEGGYYDEIAVEGYGGDYDKYLEALKKANLNYSVQDLMLRYSLAAERVFAYYAGYYEGEFAEEAVQGKLEYTEADVKAFYDSTDSVRVIRAFLPKAYYTAERAAEIRENIVKKASYGDEEVAKYIISLTSTAGSEIFAGEIIGKHNLDKAYYSEMEDSAFSLEYFGVSGVIDISTGFEDGYTILYKTTKSDAHFTENYESIASVYVQNEIGRILDTAADAILGGLTPTSALTEMNRAEIKMD